MSLRLILLSSVSQVLFILFFLGDFSPHVSLLKAGSSSACLLVEPLSSFSFFSKKFREVDGLVERDGGREGVENCSSRHKPMSTHLVSPWGTQW